MPVRTCIAKDVSITTIAWSPNGEDIAVASLDDSVQVWEALSGHVYTTSAGRKGYVDSVAWSPDGKYIAFGISLDNIFQVFPPPFPPILSTIMCRYLY